MPNATSVADQDRSQLSQARELAAAGRLAEAADLLTALVLANSELCEPYFDLGALAEDQGDRETAATLFALALERDARFAPARRRLAALQGMAQRFDDALATLSPLLRSPTAGAEDYDLLRQLLGQAPALSPIAWARLLADLKTLSPEQRQALDGADSLRRQHADLLARHQQLAAELAAVRAAARQRDSAAGAAIDDRNFCILPWKHLNLKIDGTARLCCQGPHLADGAGKPLSVYEHPIEEIWNSADMRSIRRAMVAGVRVEGCANCWKVEDRGGTSRRMNMNGAVPDLGEAIGRIRAEAGANDYRCANPPADYQLDMGNVCNLKCRTCLSQYSSRIAADPIHQLWERSGVRAAPLGEDGDGCHDEPVDIRDRVEASRFASKLPWYEDDDFLFSELLARPEQITGMHLIGGEPLVLRQFGPIIQHLYRHGRPERVTIGLTTNGTRFDASLLEALAGFGRISVSLSVDGIGEQFEYIRYPGKWADFLRHLDRYAAMKNVCLSVIPTFHAYNALDFADLLRFCDERGLRAIFNPLRSPPYLAATVLPPGVRRVAAARLLDYAAAASTGNGGVARMLAGLLAAAGDRAEPGLIRQFMLFTNDLDATRPKRFRDVSGEAVALLAADGFPWTDETLHAGAVPVRQPPVARKC